MKKINFKNCRFTIGAKKIDQIKNSHFPEYAFIGRSNVGKSSLINALFEQKIAITSKTPGRTRQLNFFLLDEKINIVDMPGYGYAKVDNQEINSWNRLSYDYFSTRDSLKRVFVLIDSRRGIMDIDMTLTKILDDMAISYQIILTKKDKIKPNELDKVVAQIKQKTIKCAALYPEFIFTSASNKEGIFEIKKSIALLS
jgi:GTP-binding protein